MKKNKWIIGIVSAAIFASLVASTVLACVPVVPTLILSATNDCEHVLISGSIVPSTSESWGTVNVGFSFAVWITGGVTYSHTYVGDSFSYLLTTPGTYNVKVQAYYKPDYYWNPVNDFDQVLNITVVACPTPTTPTPPTDTPVTPTEITPTETPVITETPTETPAPPNYIATPVCKDLPCAPRRNLLPEKGQCIAMQFIAEAGCAYDPVGDRCTEEG